MLPPTTPAAFTHLDALTPYPNPTTTTGMETPIEGNPHWPWTHDVDCPRALPYQTHTTPPERLSKLVSVDAPYFSKGPFPRLTLTTAQLFQNLSEKQVEMICRHHGETLAIVPHGAGSLFYKHNPDVADTILDFLVTLGFQGNRASLRLEAPIATYPDNAAFGYPWAMILTGCNHEMMHYLPWQQTFDLGSGIAFHVLRFFKKPTRHYPIANITWKGDVLDGTPSTKSKLLAGIRHALWGDEEFLRENAAIMRDFGMTGNEKELAIGASLLLKFTFVPRRSGHPDRYPRMAITSRAVTCDPWAIEKWARMVRELIDSKVVDGAPMRVGRRWTCFWCKSALHAPRHCDFGEVSGWKGPASWNAPQWVVNNGVSLL